MPTDYHHCITTQGGTAHAEQTRKHWYIQQAVEHIS